MQFRPLVGGRLYQTAAGCGSECHVGDGLRVYGYVDAVRALAFDAGPIFLNLLLEIPVQSLVKLGLCHCATALAFAPLHKVAVQVVLGCPLLGVGHQRHGLIV